MFLMGAWRAAAVPAALAVYGLSSAPAPPEIGAAEIIIGLLLVLEIVNISFGKISTAQFASTVEVAVFIGLLCGFSEQTLPSAIAKQASAIFQKMAPKV